MPGVTCPSCGTSLGPEQDTTTITFETGESTEADVAETPVPEVEVDLSDVPLGTGVLVVTRGEAAGSRILLDLVTTTAGRHPKSDIFLDDITVSRRHAEVRRVGDGYVVRDVGSLNGTYLNRERIDEAPLLDRAELQVGKFRLVFVAGGRPDAD